MTVGPTSLYIIHLPSCNIFVTYTYIELNISYSKPIPHYPKRTLYFLISFPIYCNLPFSPQVAHIYLARFGTLPAVYLIYLLIYLIMPTNINPCHLQYISPNHLLFLPLVTFPCYMRWCVGPQCLPLLCYIFHFAEFCLLLNFCLQNKNLAASFTCTICFIPSCIFSY